MVVWLDLIARSGRLEQTDLGQDFKLFPPFIKIDQLLSVFSCDLIRQGGVQHHQVRQKLSKIRNDAVYNSGLKGKNTPSQYRVPFRSFGLQKSPVWCGPFQPTRLQLSGHHFNHENNCTPQKTDFKICNGSHEILKAVFETRWKSCAHTTFCSKRAVDLQYVHALDDEDTYRAWCMRDICYLFNWKIVISTNRNIQYVQRIHAIP